MKIKTTMKYHFTLVRMPPYKKSRSNVGESVGKTKFSSTAGGNVNWQNHYGELNGGSILKENNIEQPQNTTVPFLGIYQEKTIIQKNTCTSRFTEAPFTIAKIQKQPKGPLTEEWTKKWYINTYTMEYYLTIKNNEIMPLTETWMDPEIIILCEILKSEISQNKMINILFICGI